MNVNKDIKITLNKEENEAVQKVASIVQEFAVQDLCKNNSCYHCSLAMFCPLTDCAESFEETLNDIANM